MTLDQQILSIPPDDFKLLLKFGSRLTNIRHKELIYLTFKQVKIELPSLLEEGKFEDIINLIVVSRKKRKLKPKKALPLILKCYDQLKKIAELEKEYLSTPPDPDMQQAGIDKLNEVGELNTTDAVAQRYGYKIEEVEEMPYHKVFDLQRKMKIESDIQRELLRIQKEKSKNKRVR